MLLKTNHISWNRWKSRFEGREFSLLIPLLQVSIQNINNYITYITYIWDLSACIPSCHSANCWFVFVDLWNKCLMITRPRWKMIFLRDGIFLRVRVVSRCRLVVERELTETAALYEGGQSPVEPGREGQERGGGLFVLLVLGLTPVSGVTLLL